MKTLMFSYRTVKEIIRDPISLFFGLVFPIVLLVLLTLINRNVPVDIFNIDMLTPGVAVFGLSFMALFSGQIIAKDRTSEFLTRLFTTPMKAKDFILGYTLPLIPIALLQTILCFVVAIFLGMKFSFSIILTIIFILPMGLVFISSGLLIGSLFSEKAVGSICGALLTNVTALFSGAWFSNSGKVMIKCGLKYEGTLRQADFSNKGIVDAAMYSLLASEHYAYNNPC